MDNLEKLMLRKIELLNNARNIDMTVKSDKAFNSRHAANNKKLEKVSAQIKEEISKRKQILDSIESINSSVNNTVQYYGAASASFIIEEEAISKRGIPNKEIARQVLSTMKTELMNMIIFHTALGIAHEHDSKKLELVNEKLSQL